VQEAKAPLPVGTVIHEHYIVNNLLGKGDFGNVYLVRNQLDEQKLFALAEVISPTEQEKYRFALHYVSLSPIDKRTLPHVQYVFNDDKLSRAYILMSSIEELNLELLRLRQPEQRFPLPQTMALMNPVINAVTYLHHRHPPVIHRNIQPANIIVSKMADAPVLVMLDVVKEQNSTTTTLQYFVPGYGAPEQYRGECSARTDIYGLGATCYTLVTGNIPPDALYRSTQLSNGEIDPLKPVNDALPAIPTSIAQAIQRAMSINADDRFPTAEEFEQALGIPATQASLSVSHIMPSTSSPPPATVPEQPHTPRPWELNGLQPAPSEQADESPALAPAPKETVAKPTPASVPKQPRAPRIALRVPRAWRPGAVFIVLTLLISLVIGAGFWLHARRGLPAAHSATPMPTVRHSTPTLIATSVSSIYPSLVGTYNGTVGDLSVNVSTSISLTGLRQSQGNISGYLVLGPKMQGSGPFGGTIDTNKHIQFIVTDAVGHATLFFEGQMQTAMSLK
jgi:serine/threonine protein kinase